MYGGALAGPLPAPLASAALPRYSHIEHRIYPEVSPLVLGLDLDELVETITQDLHLALTVTALELLAPTR